MRAICASIYIGGDHPISLTSYRWLFRIINEKVDLHDATAHIFRHSYLTLLDKAGVSPKIIQAIAGHGDIRITMNRYVHDREDDIVHAGGLLHSLVGTYEKVQSIMDERKCGLSA